MEAILKVDHIEKYYGSAESLTKALDDVSFEAAEGEFISIMGASGSGKTTLLNCISTIDTVSAGSILLGGVDSTRLKDAELAQFRGENLGFVFQSFNLLDTLTLGENISLSLSLKGVPAKKIEAELASIAARMGLAALLDKFPYQVSGGERQRCAFARAVVSRPKLILADEPTGSLDSASSRNLLEVMEELNRSMNATILLVTHDALAASYAKRILFLKDGKIFNEIIRGEKSRKAFYSEILDVLALLGGITPC